MNEELLLKTVALTEALRHENAVLRYDGAEGRLATLPDGTVLSEITDGDALCRIVHALGLEHTDQYCVQSRSAADALSRAFGLHEKMPCTQAVYLEKKPPRLPKCNIRPLCEEHLPLTAAHYHPESDNTEYLRERIASGRMWGIFDKDRLAGFIGMHTEGSMGFLEVLPEYRRRGYGYALEGYLIALHLERGWTPFCHVVEGNDASLALQKKLGMTFAPQPAIWVF